MRSYFSFLFISQAYRYMYYQIIRKQMPIHGYHDCCYIQVSETSARSDVISDRLDEVHARQVARSIERQTTSDSISVPSEETPESSV